MIFCVNSHRKPQIHIIIGLKHLLKDRCVNGRGIMYVVVKDRCVNERGSLCTY